MFDDANRKKSNPKRKKGSISTLDTVSHGACGVREFHKVNEERILAHRRSGLSDADIDYVKNKMILCLCENITKMV